MSDSYKCTGPLPTLQAAVATFNIDLAGMSAKLYQIHAQNLETSFVAALTKHLGRVPSLPEVQQHGRILWLPDGNRAWQWDGETLMEEHPAKQDGERFYLPEILVR